MLFMSVEPDAGAKLLAPRASERRRVARTVHPATGRGADCASGDRLRDRLCIWRQPGSQTVHLATKRRPKRALVVVRGTV